MKILIIEDEPGLQQSIQKYPEHQGYVCEAAGDFKERMEKVHDYNYDCVVVDTGLSGRSVCLNGLINPITIPIL